MLSLFVLFFFIFREITLDTKITVLKLVILIVPFAENYRKQKQLSKFSHK